MLLYVKITPLTYRMSELEFLGLLPHPEAVQHDFVSPLLCMQPKNS